MNKKIILAISALALVFVLSPFIVRAVTLNLDFSFNLTGIFLGFWHGLLAPYSLVIRWFLPEISMYSCQNAGWLYDFGFLVGIFMAFPIGWIAVIIALLFNLFA